MGLKPANIWANVWDSPWVDCAAFFGGLAFAWHYGWSSGDLVWSLWLASLVVGYGMIVWGIIGRIRKTRALASSAGLLGFLSLHFLLFHFLHSFFLYSLFPIGAEKGFPVLADYGRLLADYWYFLPAAFVAERGKFLLMGESTEGHPFNVIADVGSGFLKPYHNVLRMHLLIFFFIIAHHCRFDGSFVYVVVYAVYFFPWHHLKGEAPERQSV